MMITAKKFKAATGYSPKDDDLERCNCPRAGEIGHVNCGWDHDMGKPEFIAAAIRLKQQMDRNMQAQKEFKDTFCY